jgi:hypothetical protein
MTERAMLMFRRLALFLLLVFSPGMGFASQGTPDVTLEIKSRDLAFGGRSFGDHGQYEKIVAAAHMRIDPMAEENLKIVDLSLAPRAADGMVQ